LLGKVRFGKKRPNRGRKITCSNDSEVGTGKKKNTADKGEAKIPKKKDVVTVWYRGRKHLKRKKGVPMRNVLTKGEAALKDKKETS